MRKPLYRLAVWVVIGCLLIQPSLASGVLSEQRFSANVGRSLSPFQEQALSVPFLNVELSPVKQTEQLWSAVGQLVENPTPPLQNPDSLKDMQRQLFNRHDGIDFTRVVDAFNRHGIIDLLRSRQTLTINEILDYLAQKGLHGNRAYWVGGLQVLASQGWVIRELTARSVTRVRLTDMGRRITEKPFLDAYARGALFIQTDLGTVRKLYRFLTPTAPRTPSGAPQLTFAQAVQESATHWGLPEETEINRDIRKRTLEHLDGILVGMTGLTFGYRGLVSLLEKGPVTITRARWQLNARLNNLHSAIDLLVQQGWIVNDGTSISLTAKGRTALPKTLTSGVPLSYLPMFTRVDELLVGVPAKVFELDRNGNETHVARGINLIGTGAAHKSLFKRVAAEYKEIFDQPIETQPLFISDMGCGDGSYLKEVYKYILNHTLRGQLIREDPEKYKLLMIGADFFSEARSRATATLSKARIDVGGTTYSIPYQIIHGDINDWETLGHDIERMGLDPLQGIYTSTFLIHNRPFLDITGEPEPESLHFGAYASPDPKYAKDGYVIPANVVEQNLLEFLLKAKPFISRFGMIINELHGVPDEIAAAHVGEFSNTSYIATHIFSGQFIVPLPIFIEVARRAGLEVIKKELIPRDFGDGNAPTSFLYLRAVAKTKDTVSWSNLIGTSFPKTHTPVLAAALLRAS